MVVGHHKRMPQFYRIFSRKKQPTASVLTAPAVLEPSELADLPYESMGYRDIQAVAKLSGVKANGTKAEIIQRLAIV